MATLAKLAAKLSELRNEKSTLTTDLKALSKKIEAVEEEIIEEFTHTGISRIDIKGLGSFFIATRKFFKIADREALVDFLHEQGDADIMSVQHQTLNAYCKEVIAQKEAKGFDDFEIPGVTFVSKTQIRVRK